jgi:chromatin remodeling complex protein RSC6
MPVAKKAATTTVETPVKTGKKPVVTKVPVIKAADVVKAVPVEDVVKSEVVQPVTPQENALQSIIEKVNTFVVMGKELQGQLKVLSKDWEKQQKIIDKVQKKRQNAKNSPSGFAKPNKISDELCDFIGEPHGTEKSRTDITRFINAYIKEHSLNKPENKRFILPDDKLRKILNVDAKEEINYFILQKLISHHFPPSASKLAAAAAAAATAATVEAK